ncbi:sodium:proton antiporter [Aliiroseovarius sp. Z3]|uniref:cation:proton antiporter n=1 Tax=Aliiroseovarius sp. Z3 TaxID=2811402 RepID=UPI0023B2A2AF|nr:sodium:proton antiporter [Aliiroseovarius sp. Z3]MDE9451925.1 sodium:proton antiporter [Aliiroseovarius sp. Z3]
MPELILLILLAFVSYSLLSKGISRTILTLPLLFAAFGLALSGQIKSSLPPEVMHEGKKLLAEVTLVLILFSDASHVRFRRLAASWSIPARMLLIGMPLSIGLGVIVAYLIFPAAGLAMALLTAAVLTPTDAALGQSVVSNPEVPERLSQTINVESGLNDGLALPFVLLGAILASAGFGEAQTDGLAFEAITEVILGPIAGIIIGWGLAYAMDRAQNRDLMNEAAGGVVFLVAAFSSFFLAELIHGNGFIAAFVGGMVFGNTYRHDIHFISEFMEGAGQILTMCAFLVFGAILLPDGLAHATAGTVLLALCFLTFVRMVPIFVSLTGSGLPAREKLFLGWFGPRGLASILFTLLMMDAYDFPTENELLAAVSLTVGLSILLHGISATPLANRIGRMVSK